MISLASNYLDGNAAAGELSKVFDEPKERQPHDDSSHAGTRAPEPSRRPLRKLWRLL